MTTSRTLPRYPVYIISKGRPGKYCLTARCLIQEGVPFTLVVEPHQQEAYAQSYGREPLCTLITLPFQDVGSVIYARNWVKAHAKASGAERHWQLDDNLRAFYRFYAGKRLYCDAGLALRVCEDFSDRYSNLAISGLNYYKFLPDHFPHAPLTLNCHVYSCCLILNTPETDALVWRGRYNEDTDYCLQALAAGWCTALLNVFSVDKLTTMRAKGGNTEELYQYQDGRLKMARALERLWPGVVETKRRFHRPQHVIKDAWRRFDTPLQLKPGIELDKLPAIEEYGMVLMQVADTIKSPAIQALLDGYHQQDKRAK